MSFQRFPNQPEEATKTFSPGEVMLATAPSMAPVPTEAKVITGFFVRKNNCKPSEAALNKDWKPGVRWWGMGMLASAKTSAGIAVGPGAIMNFFIIGNLIPPLSEPQNEKTVLPGGLP